MDALTDEESIVKDKFYYLDDIVNCELFILSIKDGSDWIAAADKIQVNRDTTSNDAKILSGSPKRNESIQQTIYCV